MLGSISRNTPPVRIGDRVRVISPVATQCDECPHFVGEADCVGRVVYDAPSRFAPSHPYLIVFDTPCLATTRHHGPVPISSRHYAAHELEVLSDPSCQPAA